MEPKPLFAADLCQLGQRVDRSGTHRLRCAHDEEGQIARLGIREDLASKLGRVD